MEGQQREALCDLPAFGTLFSVKGDRPFVELYRIGQQHAQEEAGSPQTHEMAQKKKDIVWVKFCFLNMKKGISRYQWENIFFFSFATCSPTPYFSRNFKTEKCQWT
ncbi:hypothetical protein TNCT_110411 [Trichonephila clavata]|uniref:Uncharacterized protein n=1 Tax=Trichonephila clavata TaxID=2740835 RepID=A0A8X6FGK5_TRICU|nr:hypothetical protein TNCT_110411 [Trichonephila clavata]